MNLRTGTLDGQRGLAVEVMRRSHLRQVSAIGRTGAHRAWSVMQFQRELERPDRCYLVATRARRGRGAEVVGFAGALIVVPDAHLTTLAVASPHRRRGIATLLLARLAVDARARGCTAMTLEVAEGNDAAVALYERSGFHIEGRRARYYADLGQDALIMWCTDLDALAGGAGEVPPTGRGARTGPADLGEATP